MDDDCTQVKQQQQRVLQTLEVKRIPFETKDIAVDQDAKREFRRLMRVHDARAATPQIFNRDTHCGVRYPTALQLVSTGFTRTNLIKHMLTANVVQFFTD